MAVERRYQPIESRIHLHLPLQAHAHPLEICSRSEHRRSQSQPYVSPAHTRLKFPQKVDWSRYWYCKSSRSGSTLMEQPGEIQDLSVCSNIPNSFRKPVLCLLQHFYASHTVVTAFSCNCLIDKQISIDFITLKHEYWLPCCKNRQHLHLLTASLCLLRGVMEFHI